MPRLIAPSTKRRSLAGKYGTFKPILVIAAISCLVVGCKEQETFPSRPITLICPWSAGGGTDQVARQIAMQLEHTLGVPVNVLNATGGAGVTGHTRGAQANPDGYTITMITSELNMLHWRGMMNISYLDYEPLMQVNRDYAAVFVRADAPWSSLQELEQAIRARPGTLTASGTAFGGVWHVSMVGWLLKSGFSADAVTWIPMDGSAPSLQELMAGGLDFVVCSLPEARSLLEAGAIRTLGVMAEERLARYPGVPTFKEHGIEWTSGTWRGLAVPKGIPEERAEVLTNALRQVVAGDAYMDFLQAAGFGSAALPRQEFAAFLEQENEAYGEVFASDAFQAVTSQRYGPWLFPAVVIGLMAVTIAVLLGSGALRVHDEAQEVTARGAFRVGIAVGAIILYMLVAEQAGYVLSAALLLAVLFWTFKVKWYVAAGVVLVLVPLTYQVFAVYLRVGLPWGWLGW